MTSDYEKNLVEWLKWYNYHQPTLSNSSLDKRVEFLDKAVLGLFRLVADTANEVERNHINRNTPKIVLPTGLCMNAPLRES